MKKLLQQYFDYILHTPNSFGAFLDVITPLLFLFTVWACFVMWLLHRAGWL